MEFEGRSRGRRVNTYWPLVVMALAAGASVRAHDFSTSESSIEIDGAIVHVRLSVNALEFPGTDVNGDERIAYDELDKHIERVFEAIKMHYTLRAPDPPAAIMADRYQIVDDHVLQIDIRYTFAHSVKQLDVHSALDTVFGPTHQHLVRTSIGGEIHREILDRSHTIAHVDTRRVTATRVFGVLAAALGLAGLGVYRYRKSGLERPG